MTIKEENCARDDEKNDSRVFLTIAPSLFRGEMKLGERNDAAFMTTLMHGDIGNKKIINIIYRLIKCSVPRDFAPELNMWGDIY